MYIEEDEQILKNNRIVSLLILSHRSNKIDLNNCLGYNIYDDLLNSLQPTIYINRDNIIDYIISGEEHIINPNDLLDDLVFSIVSDISISHINYDNNILHIDFNYKLYGRVDFTSVNIDIIKN